MLLNHIFSFQQQQQNTSQGIQKIEYGLSNEKKKKSTQTMM